MIKRNIVMVGPSHSARGGITAVVSVLMNGGLFNRSAVEYIISHRDGGTTKKLATALKGGFQFLGLLLQRRVGLLHVHMASRASFWRKFSLFVLPARLFGIPYLIHLHGGEFKIFYEEESHGLGRYCIRNTFGNARAVVVLSEEWQAWAASAFPSTVIKTIYNPVTIPPPCQAMHSAGDIVFLGRIGEKKGVFDLLKAFAIVASNYPASRLLLGGDGDLPGAVRLTEDLGLSGQVRLLGWVSGEAKYELLSRASIFVLPSYNEGLPMSILEALAAGLPIVSTPVGGIPRAITSGLEGFLVNPGDIHALAERLIQLLADPDLRQRMGAAARKKAEATFAVDRVVAQWVGLYEWAGTGNP